MSSTVTGRLNRGLFTTRSVSTDRLVVGTGVVHRCQDEGDHDVLVTRDGRVVHRGVVRVSRSGRLWQTDVLLGNRADEKSCSCGSGGDRDDLAVGGVINCGVITGSGGYRVQITRRSPDGRDQKLVLDTERGISPDGLFWTVPMAPGSYEVRSGRSITPIEVVRVGDGSGSAPEPTVLRIADARTPPRSVEVVAGSTLVITAAAGGRIELVPIRVAPRRAPR